MPTGERDLTCVLEQEETNVRGNWNLVPRVFVRQTNERDAPGKTAGATVVPLRKNRETSRPYRDFRHDGHDSITIILHDTITISHHWQGP